MHTPLIDGLKKYIDEDTVRFHMPGHKGKDVLAVIKNLMTQIDLTEIPGTDNLHKASDIIDESQKNAAKVFGAKKTFYSVNGTTAGIYASITSQTKPGDKILISRDSHKSVYQSLVLGNLNCEYIYPIYDKDDHLLLGIDPEDLEKKLRADHTIRAVVVNYPSYYGVCSDLGEISKIVHKYHRLLIVDEAHGSHLNFHKDLPKSALCLGADLVIQSSHKTLPALTQSSMIHVGTDRVDVESLKLHMSIYQTTSPSYLLLSSLDFAVSYMDNFGYKKLEEVINKIEEITLDLEEIKGVSVYKKTHKALPYDFDKTKFLFSIEGITGARLEEILRKDYQIQVEMSDYYYCLALISPLDEPCDLEKLKIAIIDIARNSNYKKRQEMNLVDIRDIEAKIILSPYKAFYSDKSSVQLKKSIGEISGDFVIPYPPGIPVLVPGEKISRQITDYIENLVKEKIEVLGLDENQEIKIIAKTK